MTESNRKSDQIQFIDTVLEEIKATSDSDGKISLIEAQRLLHRLNDAPAYRGLSVHQLAEAVDVQRHWYDALLKTAPKPNYWILPAGMIAAWIVTAYFGRTDLALMISGAMLAGAGYLLGKRLGIRTGFDDGVGQGYKAAVLHAHGITPATEDEFWKMYNQASADRHVAELLDERERRKSSEAPTAK